MFNSLTKYLMVFGISLLGTLRGNTGGATIAYLLFLRQPYDPVGQPVGSQDSYAMAAGFATIGLTVIGGFLGLIAGLIAASILIGSIKPKALTASQSSSFRE